MKVKLYFCIYCFQASNPNNKKVKVKLCHLKYCLQLLDPKLKVKVNSYFQASNPINKKVKLKFKFYLLIYCFQPLDKKLKVEVNLCFQPSKVKVYLLMYCFQASDPDSLPPPVAFSPPNAPPISAKKNQVNKTCTFLHQNVLTSSRGGNIHIHDATVRTLGAQPLEKETYD